MDRVALQMLLAGAERHVEDALAIVERQRLLVRKIARQGQPGALEVAKALLLSLEDVLATLAAERDRIEKELDALPKS